MGDGTLTAIATKVCTCVGTCRGAKDLGQGWHCAMVEPKPASRLPLTVAAPERQVRAGSRVLRQLAAHPHPMVARAIREALNDLAWIDMLRFADRCEAALLEISVPAAPVHLAEMREAYDADARD